MKSPVYGRGRNRKHRANGPYHSAAANVNMRGKKTKQQPCYCCECIDLRDKMIDQQHRKEMLNTEE